MTSDGILEKELRERFGVDSIVSHLNGNVVVTLRPEAFDKLCDDEGMFTEEYVENATAEADEIAREQGHEEGYADAIFDIKALAEDMETVENENYQTGYDQALKDARAAGWDPTAVTT